MFDLNNIIAFFRRPEPPVVQNSNLGEELRKVVQSKDFEDKLSAAAPFLVASIASWPTFWLYKGLDWNSRRGIEPLPLYIRKTFFQAKFVQLLIIGTGIIIAVNHDPLHRVLAITETSGIGEV